MAARSLVEVRLLDGPNLYFPRPAAKVTLDIGQLLELDLDEARRFATEVGLTRSRPGPAASAFRQRFAARAIAHLVRRLAIAGGAKRLAVRARPGTSVNELIVAYPWRNSARAEVLADGLAAVLDAVGDPEVADFGAVLKEAADRLAATAPGSAPRLIKPRIPVVAVTGTNGKTTTSRMLGLIAQRAGLSVGWSSTDGVYLNGELVEAGDYSGPSGAGQVLSQPGVQLAVTETARGGILLRGLGVTHTDVSVVTNVSADHLGLQGVDTIDQPTTRPAHRPIRATIRDVVVLPLVPVTATRGTRGRRVVGTSPGSAARTDSTASASTVVTSGAGTASSTAATASPSASARPRRRHG